MVIADGCRILVDGARLDALLPCTPCIQPVRQQQSSVPQGATVRLDHSGNAAQQNIHLSQAGPSAVDTGMQCYMAITCMKGSLLAICQVSHNNVLCMNAGPSPAVSSFQRRVVDGIHRDTNNLLIADKSCLVCKKLFGYPSLLLTPF